VLGDAGSLLVAVLHFLRASRKADGQYSAEKQASQSHDRLSTCSSRTRPAPPHLDRIRPPGSHPSVSPALCRIVFKNERVRLTAKNGHRELDKNN
jgi:hypothetical protein